MKSLLKRLLFNLCIFFLGFRFNFTKTTDRFLKESEHDILYDSVVVPSEAGSKLVFNFYKTRTESYRYHLGHITTTYQYQLSIAPEFDRNHPDLIAQFGNKVVTFYIPYFFLIPERSITKFLLDVFITHMVKQMQNLYERQEIKHSNDNDPYLHP